MAVDAFACHDIDRSNRDIVVPVRSARRRGALEQLGKVGQQLRLVFVDDNRGCGVKALDVDEADINTGLRDQRFNVRRDVNEFGRTLGRDLNPDMTTGGGGRECLHRECSRQGARQAQPSARRRG